MRKATIFIFMLLFCDVAFAQESMKRIEVPQVDIKDSLFYQMIHSVANSAEKCPMTKELSCWIFCKKYELENSELYIFCIEPFDDFFLSIESCFGTNSWRKTTICDMPILFFFSDSNKFTVTDTSQIIINAEKWIKYEYIIINTIDMSEQSPKSLCMTVQFTKENGRYLLQCMSPCINIKESEKKIQTSNRVLYYIKE